MRLKGYWYLLWKREEPWWPNPIFAGLASAVMIWVAMRRGVPIGFAAGLPILLVRRVLYYIFIRRPKTRAALEPGNY